MHDGEHSDTSPGDSATSVGLVAPRDFVSREPFACELGGILPGLTLRYETYGELNPARDNAILVCHALSGDHHVAGRHSASEKRPGWWDILVGPGKPLDTNRWCVIGTNSLGGCRGSTGPRSLDPATGRPWNLRFPQVTIGDMVRAQVLLLNNLGISCLHAAIGGSMGGMQVLELARSFPGRVARIIPMATTARQGAMAIGFNEAARQAILADPAWCGGDYTDEAPPAAGLAVARMIGHLTYLSATGMNRKFGRNRRSLDHSPGLVETEFEVESYLRYQGAKFVGRFDAHSYLTITKAVDRFDLGDAEGRLEPALSPVAARALVLGFASDWLFPPEDNRAIAEALSNLRKDVRYAEVEAWQGHDAFLLPNLHSDRLIRAFLGEE